MPAKLFVSVQFTTKTEPTPNDLLVLDKPHKNRTGLAAALDPAQSLGGPVTGWDEGESLDWMWEIYRDFRRAFRLAKNDRFVLFY